MGWDRSAPAPITPSDRPGPRAWPVRGRPAVGAPLGPGGSGSGTGASGGGPRRGPGRAAWTVAVLSALILLVAVGAVGAKVLAGSSSAPLSAFGGARHDARAGGVDAVLAVMTRGLRAHDEARFLSAVNPRDRALVARQRAVFRGLAVLPLKDPLLAWDGQRWRPPEHPGSYPAGAVTVAADLSYLLDGWDDESADDVMALTLAPVGRGWLVVGDTEDAGTSPARRYLEPWTTGAALDVERRAHVLVVGEQARRADVRRLADHLEQVSADVRRTWPEPSWNGKVVAYAVTDDRFVAAWFAAQAATGPPGGATGAVPTWEARVGNLARSPAGDDAQSGPPRLVITPYVLGRSDARVLPTLRHEVTHVATARLGRLAPGWLVEGAAEYTGFRLGSRRVDALRTFTMHGLTPRAADQLRRGTWQPQLVTDRQAFYSGTAQAVAAAYLDAWIACLYIADRYGDATLRQVYDAASAQPATAGADAVDAEALRAVLHVDHAGLTAAVRAYGLSLYHSATRG